MEHTSNPLLSSFPRLVEQFLSETDRAAVILGAAQIDYLLGELLDKYLLPNTSSTDDLLEGDSPLATFSARIKMCHRIGLLDERCTKLLHTFRRLRNGFAHEVANNSLDHGPARDRVHALVDPLLDVPYFKRAVTSLAKGMKRPTTDAGVLFRAFLANMHVYLANLHQNLKPLKRVEVPDFVAFMKRAPEESTEGPPSDGKAA